MGSQTSVLRIRAKTQEVVDHHHDDSTPGKPIYLLIAGGTVALPSLALIFWIAYQTWYTQDMSFANAQPMLMLLVPFYIGGVFLFSYGYELYDVAKALKLTAIVVFVSLAAVVIVAVLFALIAGGAKSSGSSSSSTSSNSNSSSSTSSRSFAC